MLPTSRYLSSSCVKHLLPQVGLFLPSPSKPETKFRLQFRIKCGNISWLGQQGVLRSSSGIKHPVLPHVTPPNTHSFALCGRWPSVLLPRDSSEPPLAPRHIACCKSLPQTLLVFQLGSSHCFVSFFVLRLPRMTSNSQQSPASASQCAAI